MSRLLSVCASVFTALFVILFVIGVATTVNIAAADEPLLNCAFGQCPIPLGAFPCDDSNGDPIDCGTDCGCYLYQVGGDYYCKCEDID